MLEVNPILDLIDIERENNNSWCITYTFDLMQITFFTCSSFKCSLFHGSGSEACLIPR